MSAADSPLAVSCLVCQCLNTCCGLGFRVTIYINRSAVIDLRRMRRPSEAVVSVTSVTHGDVLSTCAMCATIWRRSCRLQASHNTHGDVRQVSRP